MIITETHLDGDISSSEVIPTGYLQNTPLRCDRNIDGGGVLLAVRDGYTLIEIKLPENPAEIVWGEVQLKGDKKLILGGYYRTPSGHAVTQQEEFETSVSDLKSKITPNDMIIIGGDFNFRDINWDEGTIAPCTYERSASQMLIDTLGEHHLSQMQRKSTRAGNTLDLYITNRPSLVKAIDVVPNISDHDAAIIADSNITAVTSKKTPRIHHVFSRANWPAMKEDITKMSHVFLANHGLKSVDDNWEHIKSTIKDTITKNVPTKTTSSKKRHPWITSALRRKTMRRHRMYLKARRSKNKERMARYRTFSKSVDKEIRQTKVSFINEHIVGGLTKGNTKPFYKYIKSLKNESIGLAPLKQGADLITDPKAKADILLNEFSGVFTTEDVNSIPWLGPCK